MTGIDPGHPPHDDSEAMVGRSLIAEGLERREERSTGGRVQRADQCHHQGGEEGPPERALGEIGVEDAPERWKAGEPCGHDERERHTEDRTEEGDEQALAHRRLTVRRRVQPMARSSPNSRVRSNSERSIVLPTMTAPMRMASTVLPLTAAWR